MIERIYHPYTVWEDWGCGMYRPCQPSMGPLEEARALLADPVRCHTSMQRVLKEWPRAAEHNLTDPRGCKRPWLGRAAVNVTLGFPEDVTRLAWNLLTLEEKDRANSIADGVISEWRASRQPTANAQALP